MNKKDYHDEPLCLGGHLVFEKCGLDAEYRGEVKRVIHAYWIEREKEFIGGPETQFKNITGRTIRCSDCGNELLGGDPIIFKYCPTCGAKMDLKPRGAIAKYKLMTGWMKEDKE